MNKKCDYCESKAHSVIWHSPYELARIKLDLLRYMDLYDGEYELEYVCREHNPSITGCTIEGNGWNDEKTITYHYKGGFDEVVTE